MRKIKFTGFLIIIVLYSFSQKQNDSVLYLGKWFNIGTSLKTYAKNFKDEKTYLGDSIFYFFRYKNDTLIKTQYFRLKDTNLVHEGQCIEYRKNGCSAIYFFKNGKIEGLYYEFHENNLLKIQSKMKNNVFEGSYIEYYLNGRIKSKGTMKMGVSIGNWKYFYNSGGLQEKGNYLVIELTKANQKLYVDFIDNWKGKCVFLKDGIWKKYDENGKEFEIKIFKKGKLQND